MMSLPSYTDGTQPIDYSWEQADWSRSAQQKLKAQDRISGLRSRPLLALAIGHGEFILRRQDPPDRHDEVFGNLVEAFWAACIDRRYLRLVAKENRYNTVKNKLVSENVPLLGELRTAEDIKNREIGPKWVAISHILNAVDDTTRTSGSEMRVIYLSNLVSQILGKSPGGTFRKWRDAVMHRFEGKDGKAPHSYFWLKDKDFESPDSERNMLGPILPPQVIDPYEFFTPDIATPLAQVFLAKLNTQVNPFLTPHHELKMLGMERPYQIT